MREAKKILIISSDKNLSDVLKFCFDGWGYEVLISQDPVSDIAPIKKSSPDVIVVDVHSANARQLEICRLLKDDFLTAFIPIITLIDKRQLRSHLLNIKQGVDDYLIKPPDPLDLRVRIEMAMRRSQYSFYSTPLTGLPGGRIIEETIKERMKGLEDFSFGYIDIDNFKYFNDTYGYVRGDRAIMQTAYMLYSTVSKFGNKKDFLGHIGGDDFVFLTTPNRYREICSNFIQTFNRIMPFHYSAEDRKNGYVVARDRTHNIKKIPLMSISIAVANNTRSSDFKNVIEINEKVAEVKRYLKTFEGSKFMADRREPNSGAQNEAVVYKIKDSRPESYSPLGQRLLKDGLVTEEKLDEALVLHWRRGVRLGEVLREMRVVSEKDLASALKKEAKT